MANNQMVNFNSQDVANMYRRNQLANALQERMNAPTPVHTYQGFQAPVSPLTGISKALDIYSVMKNEQNQEDKYQAEKAAAEQKVLDENSRLEQGRENFVSNLKQPIYSETPMPDSRSSSESGIPLDQPRDDVYTATPKTDQEKLAFALSHIGNPNQLVSTTAKGYVDQANEDIKSKTAADLAASNRDYTRFIDERTRQDMLSGRDQTQFNANRAFGQKERGIPMTPAQEIKFSADINKSYQTAVTALSVLTEVSKSIEAVKTAPDLAGSTGIQSYFPSFPNSDASVTDVRLENLKGKMTLLGKAASSASGAIGPMAIQEWKIVRDMVADIDPKKGDKALLEQITLAENQIAGSEQRIKEFYNNQYSDYFEKFPKLSSLERKESPPNVKTPDPLGLRK